MTPGRLAQGVQTLLESLAPRVSSALGIDASRAMLALARARLAKPGLGHCSVRQADMYRLPFADAGFDLVVLQMVLHYAEDPEGVLVEAARVLRPGGRFVFSTTHPIRWTLPDDPGYPGLTVSNSYFDRTPYVEQEAGITTYVEHHRTLGDRVREITAAGLRLIDLVEPEWPDDNQQVWGGWSPLRGALIPGTAIFVCQKPS